MNFLTSRVAAVRLTAPDSESRPWLSVPSMRAVRMQFSNSGRWYRTRNGGFDRYPLPKRIPTAADLGRDLWEPRCPVPNASARLGIAT